jgi:hypothetical protein
MNEELWTKVDDYINGITIARDAALEAASASAIEAGLPPISVTPAHGKLLHLMATAQGAKRILEIGTLAGYSTIWLARAVPPDGRVITLEAKATHADIARANIERAGLADRVDIRLGAALDTLPQLAAEKQAPSTSRSSTRTGDTWPSTSTGPSGFLTRQHDHRGQRGAQGRRHRRGERGHQRQRRAPLQRTPQDGHARHRDDGADRRREGLRRLRHGARSLMAVVIRQATDDDTHALVETLTEAATWVERDGRNGHVGRG